MRFYNNIYAEINLDDLIHNLNIIKKMNKNQKIIAVVKDDAYGHGSVEISKKLIENNVGILAVGHIFEAIELRKEGIEIPILIMGITPIEYTYELLKYRLTQTITSFEYAVLLSREICKFSQKLKIHIKIDTGMGRVGLFASDENYEIVNNIFRNPCFEVEGIYSHFSDADKINSEYTFMQYKLFNTFCNNLNKLKLNIKYKHICNSAGSINFDFDSLNSIRPGIALYGYAMDKQIKFKPIMSLKSRIVHIKKANKGDFIGYGKTYKVNKESVIATVNVGYGYGYPRYLSNKGKVIVSGEYANIVGNVCMDHFMIDITHINNVNIFDEVILIGEMNGKAIDANDIAIMGNTISYEVLCGIRRKVSRVYISDNKVLSIREVNL